MTTRSRENARKYTRGGPLWKYLAKERGLSEDQLEFLAGTGNNITKRAALHAKLDPAVRRAIGSNLRDFTQVFEAATGKPRFLQGGVYGITALMNLPGITSPVVVKFTEKPTVSVCKGAIGAMVCRNVHRKDLHKYQWTANIDSSRERDIYMFLSDVEAVGASPHFLHTYLGQSVTLKQEASIQKVALWLGADKRKVSKYGSKSTTTLGVNVLEYGGITMPAIIKHVIAKESTDTGVQMVKSALTQIMQALTVMVSVGNVHHNDLHTENIMGSVTNATHLYYHVVSMSSQAGKVLSNRLFRVPTFGMLWRIIDFGLATSTTLFGPQDHGIMARCAYGGPMWDGAVGSRGVFKDLPLELFDAARVLSSLQSDASYLPRTMKDKVRAMIEAIADKAISIGKKHHDTIAIRKLHTLDELEPDDVSTARDVSQIQDDIKRLTKGSADHGLMAHLFMHIASGCGYEITASDSAAKQMTAENTFEFSVVVSQ